MARRPVGGSVAGRFNGAILIGLPTGLQAASLVFEHLASSSTGLFFFLLSSNKSPTKESALYALFRLLLLQQPRFHSPLLPFTAFNPHFAPSKSVSGCEPMTDGFSGEVQQLWRSGVIS